MTLFYLCRHGQTEWNKEERFRGRKDVPLSEQGHKEAECLADALEKEKIDMLYASPLTRTMQTLTPLAKRLGKQIEPIEELIDMNFGDWEGLAVAEVEQKYPEMFEDWKNHPEQVTFPGGENLALVQARAMRGIARLAVAHPDASVALCSHRVITKLVVLGLFWVLPDKFWVVRQDTVCINRFTYNPPDAVVFSVNDTHHLDKLGGTLKKDF